MNVRSPSMDYKSNNGFLHRAQCIEALIDTALADMYVSLLRIFSYDLYCRSVRLCVCSCSCCDGKGIVPEIAERILYDFYFPLTPTRQHVSDVCSCHWFATSLLRRWSRSFVSISSFLIGGRKRRLDMCTVSAVPCR